MIKRIVKLTFREAAIPDFMAIFEASKDRIRGFDGCHHMELLQSLGDSRNVLFTLSVWESEAALDRYRQSELFRTTWERTKLLFADKPEAWSVEVAG